MKPKNGQRIVITEEKYCGIEFARVGDVATVIEQGVLNCGFWVVFDCKANIKCLILTEHNEQGWRMNERSQQVAA